MVVIPRFEQQACLWRTAARLQRMTIRSPRLPAFAGRRPPRRRFGDAGSSTACEVPAVGRGLMQLTRWNPLVEMDEVQQRLNRLLFDRTARTVGEGFADFMPAVDIHETDNEFLVRADLPGLKKEEIKIQVADGVLALEGERRQEKEEKGKRFHKLERECRPLREALCASDRSRRREGPCRIQGRCAQRRPAEGAGGETDTHRGKSRMKTPVKYVAGGAALAALGYAAFAGAKWAGYGHASRATRPDDQDPLARSVHADLRHRGTASHPRACAAGCDAGRGP